MKCYRTNCKEECNELKKLYCIFKLNKKQQRFIAKLEGYCKECGTKLIKAKYKGEYIDLCTSCGVRGKVA